MQRLMEYFTQGISSRTLETIGMEVETQFLDERGCPISTDISQRILQKLVDTGWSVAETKGNLITTLTDTKGSKILYELGRHNIELATVPSTTKQVVGMARDCLDQIYRAAKKLGAFPYFAPILLGSEDLLVIPDERDAIWLELDGRAALAPLARISSVQFTVSLSPMDAIRVLNALGNYIGLFISDFPQNLVWQRYIEDSRAGYLSGRYGGPLVFESLCEYCQELSCHDVVQGTQLIPYADQREVDIPLYLRSVWWHFRLKRYRNSLCVEVRPLARRSDDCLSRQLDKVLSVIGL